MMQVESWLRWALTLAVCVSSLGHWALGDTRPNIIYIMSDDMGYSDIGCYGSEIETPQLDALAANGLRFTQFYNMARCCPTRACLLTGLYPHQAGVGHMMSDNGYDGYRGELNRNCVTIAEVLSAAGYRTYMSGKWHVTQATRPKTEEDKHNWPLQRGFDRFYGTIHGAGSFFDPNSLTRDNKLISPFADPEYQPENGFYYTDAISDQAARFVREHVKEYADQPFFMYVSYTAAHWPMHAREQDIAKYEGRYDRGYEAVRADRYRKMIELGVIEESSTENWPLEEGWKETEFAGWDTRNMEVYAAMIDAMDQGIGRLVSSLRETRQLENTLILFFQDNGGCAEGYGRGGEGEPRASQPTLEPLADDYLQPDMQPKQTRDGYPVRTGKGVMAGAADTYLAYGKAWATVSNTPFREYKHWVHEGGISTPLIAHWPAKIHRHGELESTPSHLIDLMATAVDLASAKYPDTFHDGKAIKPMEGISLLPLFLGDRLRQRVFEERVLYWEHEGNRAVRHGDFKLVAKGADGEWELYNIDKDRSEQRDLADQYPQQVDKMANMFQAFAERANVLPLVPYRKDSGRDFKQDKLEFMVQQNDHLNRYEAPYVVDRGIVFSASISAVTNGVLVAQGGTAHGWAVYLDEGRLCLATTTSGKRTVLRADQPINGSGQVKTVIQKDRKVCIYWNGEQIAEGRLESLLSSQPADGLQVGYDELGNVGDYTSPNRFLGEISQATIRLRK